MAGSLPKFGRVDLEIDDASGRATAPPPARASGPPNRTPTFGEIDLESIMGSDRERLKPFTPKPVKQHVTRVGLEAVTKLAAEETRIAKANVLADAVALSCRPPAPPPPVDGDSSTRIGSFDQIVGGLLVDEHAPPSRTAPSSSGVASRDDRVAVMRELYAQGNAEAALALATSLDLDREASDPYGGLIPVDESGELEELPQDDEGYADQSSHEDHTAIVEASADSRRLVALTSRHVPRLLVGPREISKLPMDPRAAFLLGHIDGIQTMEEILDVCAMPESEALELIEWLRSLNVIRLD